MFDRKDILGNMSAINRAMKCFFNNGDKLLVCENFNVIYFDNKKLKIDIDTEVRFVRNTNELKVQVLALENYDLHTEYSMKWQKFSFNINNRILTIKGQSSKTRRNYEIHITKI